MESNNMNIYSAEKILNFFVLFDTVTEFLIQPQKGDLTAESIDTLKFEIEEFSKRVDQFVTGFLTKELPETGNPNYKAITSSYIVIGNVFLGRMKNLNDLLTQSLQKLQNSGSYYDENLMDYLNKKNWVVYDLSYSLQRNIDLFKIVKPILIFD